MLRIARTAAAPAPKSRLERALSVFTDVRAGEGLTAALMLANIFLLLICYSVIKTVREPLILLGGGAEVRSYAAAGQALMLIGFVPLYSWVASKVGRAKLLVAMGLFFIAGIELFAMAVAARVPYVGVAFFIWVGIFNMSLVAQFWSFANDIYSKDQGDRLFPIIMVGMTAGAPLGSLVARQLFRSGIAPSAILQVAAVLLAGSVALYLWINHRVERRTEAVREPLASGGGFGLVLASPYLRLVAALIVLLNIVNTTGEYLVARLLTDHVNDLAAMTPGFDKQAYIGAFTGDYQFWVNVTAFLLQAFATSRLVKYAGLRGALLALPLIALGGYAIIGAGVGFAVVRWIKTAENATDYSVMNTARQLLWLPTSREEKYKAKQAIDTFFTRAGDVLSALVVYVGASVLQLSVEQFAIVNVVMTLLWLGIALRIVGLQIELPRPKGRVLAPVAAVVALLVAVSPAFAQQTREEQLAAQQAEKAANLGEYRPDTLEGKLQRIEGMLMSTSRLYPYFGSTFDGGGLAVGPGFRQRLGETGAVNAHAAWSIKNYKAAEAEIVSPRFANERLSIAGRATWLDAPGVAFYGVGNDTLKDARSEYSYRTSTIGAAGRVHLSRFATIGVSLDRMRTETAPVSGPVAVSLAATDPTYRRTSIFGEVDTRTSPGYTRRGTLLRAELADYAQTNAGIQSFRRFDIDARQYIPLLRENWVIALRALATTTSTDAGEHVPYFMLPDLGGSHTLRGYSAWRFRDRNRLLMSAEYRWTAGQFVDMALFVDAGKVAPEASDLNLKGLTKSYGVGANFHTPTSTVMRVEVARTREGMSLGLSFSPSF